MRRSELTGWLDRLLDIDSIDDESANGLQVEGRESVTRVGFAVDYSPELVDLAVQGGVDLLFVHHGFIWGGLRHIRGVRLAFLRPLLLNGISLYAAHLPLDAHPVFGHSACMGRMLGLEDTQPFGPYKGKAMGVIGRLPVPSRREEFVDRIRDLVSPEPLLLPFGPDQVSRVAIVSGGAAGMAVQAAEAGADFYLTGEPNHGHYHATRAAGINTCFGGHYHTEKWGVLAVMERVQAEGLAECVFYDLPTPF